MLFFSFSLSQLSVSYPSLIPSLSAVLINVILPSGDILLFLGPFWRSPLITKLYLLWNSPPSFCRFCCSKEWSFGPRLSINSICFIGQWLTVIKIQQHIKCIFLCGSAQWMMKSLHFFYHTHILQRFSANTMFQLSHTLGSTDMFHDNSLLRCPYEGLHELIYKTQNRSKHMHVLCLFKCTWDICCCYFLS